MIPVFARGFRRSCHWIDLQRIRAIVSNEACAFDRSVSARLRHGFHVAHTGVEAHRAVGAATHDR